jgi:hypothetical protein
MMRCCVALVMLLALRAHADERNADQLRGFVVGACEYFAEHHPINAEDAHAHFGKLLRREWVTKQVGTPHARFHVDANRLHGWPVSLENSIEIKVTMPRNVHITVGELEKLVGDADTDDADVIPKRFAIDKLGPGKMCTVILFGDGKSGHDDWRRQRLLSIAIED